MLCMMPRNNIKNLNGKEQVLSVIEPFNGVICLLSTCLHPSAKFALVEETLEGLTDLRSHKKL